MTPDIRLFTDWFLGLLSATGKPVGDIEVPVLPDPNSAYCIVYPVPGGGFSGPPLVAPDTDAELIFQVTSAGKTREQAQWMAARTRMVVTDRLVSGVFQVTGPAPPDGWQVIDRQPVGGPGGVDAEGKLPHRVYSVPDRYRIYVTPV